MIHKRHSLSNDGPPGPPSGATARARDPRYSLSTPSTKPQPPLQQRRHHQLLAVSSSLFWMVCSSALIIFNKELYDNGLPFPLTVTGVGQAASAAAALLAGAGGGVVIRPPPSPRFFLVRVAPIVLSCAATMAFGNAAYLHLSMAFIQLLKAATPAITLATGLACGMETVSPQLLLALALIMGGTGAAVLLESGAPSFSALGLLLFLLSSITESTRVVWSQVLLGPYKYNSAEAMLYINAPAALVLLVAGAVWEGPRGMWGAYWTLLQRQPFKVVAAGTSSALVNWSSYMAIAATGSLTFKVVGCLKNIAVVLYGTVAYDEHITGLQVLSYGVSMAGFGLFTMAKAKQASMPAASSSSSRRDGGSGSGDGTGSDGGNGQLHKLA